jgi:hypothetical protein
MTGSGFQSTGITEMPALQTLSQLPLMVPFLTLLYGIWEAFKISGAEWKQ